MAIQIIPFFSSWRDAKGFVGRVRMHISTDDTVSTVATDVNTVAADVIAAIGGLTNAALDSFSVHIQSPPTLTYGDNLQYAPEWIKANMMFLCDDGTRHIFKIPAPEIDIFDTDGVTVLNDGTQAQVVSYVAAMKTAVNSTFPCSQSGQAFTHFAGGILKVGKQPKRFNELIKSSHLVAGEGE